MTDVLEQRLSEVLKTAPLAAPSSHLSGKQTEERARARRRRHRSIAGVASTAAAAVVFTVGVGVVDLRESNNQAEQPHQSSGIRPTTAAPSTTRQTSPCFCGPAPIPSWLAIRWPPGPRHPHRIEAVVGKPLTVRAVLHLSRSDRPLVWIQMFVSYPGALNGVPWNPGELTHQLAASPRLYGADARQGQQLTMTWTPTRPGSYRVTTAQRFAEPGGGANGAGVGGLGGGSIIIVRPA